MSFQYVTISYCWVCKKYYTNSPFKEISKCLVCQEFLDIVKSINPEAWLEYALNNNLTLSDLKVTHTFSDTKGKHYKESPT